MPDYTRVIEELVVQKGEKKGYYFVGDITTTEILERLDLPINRVNHKRALHTIRAFYPQSSFEEVSGEQSFYMVRVRIRTK